MRVRLAVWVLMLSMAGAVWSGSDGYAAGAGGTQPVNLNAATQSGAYGNPALLGLDRTPRAGMSFLPPPMSVGLWSDDLALPSVLVNKYLWDGVFNGDWDWPRLVTSVLYESFDLRDVKDDPDKVSSKFTDGMRDGVGIYFGFQISPFVLSMNGLSTQNGFSFGLRTCVDLEVRLPGGIMLPFFSVDEGLLSGKALDLSTLSVELIAATELAIKLGRPISALPRFFDYLNLDRGAYGVGIKHIMGHSYVSLKADNGSKIEYDTTADAYIITLEVDAVHAGTGLKQDWSFESSYWENAFLMQPVVGEGWGFDIGAVFHNDNHFVSLDIQDIGMIVWDGGKTRRNRGHYKDTLSTMIDSLTDPDYLDNFGEDFFNNMIDATEESSGKNHISYLPMALNLGYTYYYDLSDMGWKYLVRYLSANAGVRQQIITGPGKNITTPMLLLGASAGIINGVFPVRYGVIIGGPGKSSSAISTGVNMRALSIDLSYKAIGHPFLVAKKGFEGSAAFTVNWGWTKKKKKARDIITDKVAPVPAPAPDTAAPVLIPDTAASVLVPDTAAPVSIPDTIITAPIPDTASADTVSAQIPVPIHEPMPVAPPPPIPVPVAPLPAY